MSARLALKARVLSLLEGEDLGSAVREVLALPPRQAVNPLIGALCREDAVRWRAVACLGRVVARLADEDLEAARVVVRRFMWMLNEESGGMAWGVPEAMAESLAQHPALAREYASILISYIWTEGNYLEYPPAQRGVVWGVGRLAAAQPALVSRLRGPEHLLHLLSSPDEVVRTLCLWAYGQMGPEVVGDTCPRLVEHLRSLAPPAREVLLLEDLSLVTFVADRSFLETLLQQFLTSAETFC